MSENSQRLKTWRGNKSVRLRPFDYREHVPYHIVIRCLRDTAPFLQPRLAEMAMNILVAQFAELHAYLAAYCIMPDHAHVLMSPDECGLAAGTVIGRYKGRTTRESWSLGWSGRLWQARFYDHIVRKSEDVRTVARYIYENPDRRGLPNDYPFRWVDADICVQGTSGSKG